MRARTINNLDTMTPKVTNPGARVRCKRCDKTFDRLDWMTNKVCDNPDCNCPEIQKSMKAANDAINKAKTTSRINTIKIVTETIPTERDESKKQYVMDAAPITSITVTPPKGKK
jgi:hypothetical protein